MITKIVVAAAALAPLVSAVPYNPQWKGMNMITETAITTVNVAVTVWVDENGRVFSTDYPTAAGRVVPSTSASTTSSTVALSSSPSSAAPSVPKATTSVVTTPAVSTPVAAPSTSMTTQAAVTTPAYVAPAPSTTAKTTAAAVVSPVANAVSSSNSGSARSAPNGPCIGSDSNCVGDITHWDGGLGACGWNVDTNSQMQIALPVGLMGPLSNSNPYCGQSVTIKNPNTGATVQATVGDKCMGCTGYSIDLTNALFNAIGGGCDGRCGGFQWWFN